jgi:dipeptidyl aminopeptidase/acylaminoacyl peptidase
LVWGLVGGGIGAVMLLVLLVVLLQGGNDTGQTAQGKPLEGFKPPEAGALAEWDKKRKAAEAAEKEAIPLLQKSRKPGTSELASFRLAERGIDYAFAPDMKSLAVVADEQLTLRELATMKVLRVLAKDARDTQGMNFSPDGRLVAVKTHPGPIRVWETASGKLKWKFPHENIFVCPTSLAISPDSKVLVAGGTRQLKPTPPIRRWDLEKGVELPLGSFPAYSKADKADVRSFAFSPDGSLLAAGKWGGAVHLYDARTGQERRLFPSKASSIDAVAFSPDGKILAMGGNGGDRDKSYLKLFFLETGKEADLSSTLKGIVLNVTFTPDGATLLADTQQQSPVFYEVPAGRIKNGVRIPASTWLRRISPGGHLVIATSPSEGSDRVNTLRFWRVADLVGNHP